MSLTDDPSDQRIKRGAADTAPVPQNDVYLVLSEEERAKGFVRPVRRSYRHVGIAGPKYQLRDLLRQEIERHGGGPFKYAKFEAYPESESPLTGRYWTQEDLDRVGKGCGAVTKMGQALAETYARDPGFYGATYCVGCSIRTRRRGRQGGAWEGTDERVGT